MTARTQVHGLQVANELHSFINQQVLPGTGVDPAAFWQGFDAIVADLAPKNAALLAYAHIMAFLMLATFMTSETALCRQDWINPAVVRRLVWVNLLTLVSGALVLATGLARIAWGVKGSAWYWGQPLLHAKITLLVMMLGLALLARRRYLRWRQTLDTQGSLPAESDLRGTRRLVMWAAHLMVLVPLLAVFLARGVGTR